LKSHAQVSQKTKVDVAELNQGFFEFVAVITPLVKSLTKDSPNVSSEKTKELKRRKPGGP
jgi:hypothetical protein